MENECTGTDNGYGVELDWLRALWDYHTDPGTAPNHRDIFEQAAAYFDDPGFDHDLAYAYMYIYAYAAGFGTRWDSVSSYNGIDH